MEKELRFGWGTKSGVVVYVFDRRGRWLTVIVPKQDVETKKWVGCCEECMADTIDGPLTRTRPKMVKEEVLACIEDKRLWLLEQKTANKKKRGV